MTKATLPLSLCLLTVWLLTAPPAVQADNWTRFRGPNGTGIAKDRDIPVKFDDKTNLLWKVALPGTGHSSPVIWGKRLFVQTATANAKERQLLCLDAVTGKQLWPGRCPASLPRFASIVRKPYPRRRWMANGSTWRIGMAWT